MIRSLKVHREVRKVDNHNVIYDDKVVKYTINIPIDTYAKITKICRERRIHRSVWFREAVGMAFNMTHTQKELIDYEIMRRMSMIDQKVSLGDLPEKVTTSSARTEPDHMMHKYPGFIGGLRKNSFVYNLFRREAGQ
jgi:hypothetical protein